MDRIYFACVLWRVRGWIDLLLCKIPDFSGQLSYFDGGGSDYFWRCVSVDAPKSGPVYSGNYSDFDPGICMCTVIVLYDPHKPYDHGSIKSG